MCMSLRISDHTAFVTLLHRDRTNRRDVYFQNKWDNNGLRLVAVQMPRSGATSGPEWLKQCKLACTTTRPLQGALQERIIRFLPLTSTLLQVA